jgi:hypothetical protein
LLVGIVRVLVAAYQLSHGQLSRVLIVSTNKAVNAVNEPFDGVHIPLLRGREHSHHRVTLSRPVFVALLLFDGERLPVPGLGGWEVALLLGNHAQLVVRNCRPVFVALLLFDEERLPVPGFGSWEVALLLGNDAQLVVSHCRRVFVA